MVRLGVGEELAGWTSHRGGEGLFKAALNSRPADRVGGQFWPIRAGLTPLLFDRSLPVHVHGAKKDYGDLITENDPGVGPFLENTSLNFGLKKGDEGYGTD